MTACLILMAFNAITTFAIAYRIYNRFSKQEIAAFFDRM